MHYAARLLSDSAALLASSTLQLLNSRCLIGVGVASEALQASELFPGSQQLAHHAKCVVLQSS